MTPDMALALEVSLDNPGNWGDACTAWIERPWPKKGSQCGRVRAAGYLCNRHHGIATNKREHRRAKEQARDAAYTARIEARRAKHLDDWMAELGRIDARLAHLWGTSATTDMAAYGGAMHRSVVRSVNRGLSRTFSDAAIEEAVKLGERRDRLIADIGPDHLREIGYQE